jgi:hypothetical protein
MAVGMDTPRILPAAASETPSTAAASVSADTASSGISVCAKLAGETDNAIATAIARSFFLNISYPHPFFEILNLIHL